MSVSSEARSSRLDSLTGLRFIAAFLVFVYHATFLSVFANAAVQNDYSRAVDNAGAFGVSFFFVLSGFVLTWSARPGDRPQRFWRRRAAKILPNHVVAFVLALLLLLVASVRVPLGSALATLFLVHSWIPDPHYMMTSVNGVTWSLSAELVFYLLFPLLLPLVNKIRDELLWYALVAAGVLALLVPVVALTCLPAHPLAPFTPYMSWPRMWFSEFFPLTRALEFLTGMVMARIVLSGRWIKLGIVPAIVLAGLVYTLSLHVPTIYKFASLYPVPLSLVIAAAAATDVRGRRTGFNSRPMIWLGDISFAFYLLHGFMIFTLHAALSGKWAAGGDYQGKSLSTPLALLFLLGALLTIILMSRLLYRLVEMPAMRRWGKSRRPMTGPAPVTPARQPFATAAPASLPSRPEGIPPEPTAEPAPSTM